MFKSTVRCLIPRYLLKSVSTRSFSSCGGGFKTLRRISLLKRFKGGKNNTSRHSHALIHTRRSAFSKYAKYLYRSKNPNQQNFYDLYVIQKCYFPGSPRDTSNLTPQQQRLMGEIVHARQFFPADDARSGFLEFLERTHGSFDCNSHDSTITNIKIFLDDDAKIGNLKQVQDSRNQPIDMHYQFKERKRAEPLDVKVDITDDPMIQVFGIDIPDHLVPLADLEGSEGSEGSDDSKEDDAYTGDSELTRLDRVLDMVRGRKSPFKRAMQQQAAGFLEFLRDSEGHISVTSDSKNIPVGYPGGDDLGSIKRIEGRPARSDHLVEFEFKPKGGGRFRIRFLVDTSDARNYQVDLDRISKNFDHY